MFRKLTDEVCASPQISLAEVAEAKAMGFAMIVNNRPEDESDDQTPGAEIESAARAAGMDYCAIPVTHAGFSEGQVTAMAKALSEAKGPVLAYCRSGTRSIVTWSLGQAISGARPRDELVRLGAAAGYHLAPVLG